MWKISLAVLVTVVVAIAAALGLAAASPSTYRLECSALVSAPPPTLVSQLADLQNWIAWSPHEARDPKIARHYGGRATGPGASYYWTGNASVGSGRMTVVGVSPDHVDVEMEVETPSHSFADLEFRLAPEGTGTRVTWTLLGENGLVDRMLWFLADRRGRTAADMEERLGRLRAVVEALPQITVHRMERSVVVAAPPETVQARIADLRGWAGWSPWKGPRSETASYGGSASGVGSSLYWSGGEAEGQGRVTIVAASPESVDVEVEVGSGGVDRTTASNDMEFRISSEGKGTRVTWMMTGDGGLDVADLERGLARLKALSEARER